MQCGLGVSVNLSYSVGWGLGPEEEGAELGVSTCWAGRWLQTPALSPARRERPSRWRCSMFPGWPRMPALFTTLLAGTGASTAVTLGDERGTAGTPCKRAGAPRSLTPTFPKLRVSHRWPSVGAEPARLWGALGSPRAAVGAAGQGWAHSDRGVSRAPTTRHLLLCQGQRVSQACHVGLGLEVALCPCAQRGSSRGPTVAVSCESWAQLTPLLVRLCPRCSPAAAT